MTAEVGHTVFRRRHTVIDQFGDRVASVLEADGWIDVEIERPVRAAFTIDDPDPDVPTLAGALLDLLRLAGWTVEEAQP